MNATPITTQLLRAFRADLDAAIAPLRDKYGLGKLASGKCTYDPEAGAFTMKVEGVANGAKGKAAVLYEQAGFLGLPPLGTTFKDGHHSYTITGLNTTGTKVTCDRDDDKPMLVKVEALKRILARGQS